MQILLSKVVTASFSVNQIQVIMRNNFLFYTIIRYIYIITSFICSNHCILTVAMDTTFIAIYFRRIVKQVLQHVISHSQHFVSDAVNGSRGLNKRDTRLTFQP